MEISKDSHGRFSRAARIVPRSLLEMGSRRPAPEAVVGGSKPLSSCKVVLLELVMNSKRNSHFSFTPEVNMVGVAEMGMAGVNTTRVEYRVFSKHDAWTFRVVR